MGLVVGSRRAGDNRVQRWGGVCLVVAGTVPGGQVAADSEVKGVS